MKLNDLFSLLLVLFLSGCGGSGEEESKPGDFEPVDNSAAVQAYYDANPDFFAFKTIEDLPADLPWENGAHLPEMGSPEAKKGGTHYVRIQDFPRTLRTVGPDANGSFRGYIWDDVMVELAHRHFDEFEFYPGLANEWAIDRENKTVYIRLDPKARWSDGEEITTDDFFFAFYFYRSPNIVAPWYNQTYKTQYTNITRYDDLTFSVSVPSAKPDMEYKVLSWVRPRPEHFYKDFGEDYVERYQWVFEPTTAAYVLNDGDLNKGRSVTLTRQSDWWAKDKKHFRYRYNPDRIRYTVIRDTAKEFEAFKRGDLDRFNLNQAEYWYEKLPDTDPDVAGGYIHKSQFYNDRPRPPYGLWINSSRPLLDNRDIRVGIGYASNWELILEKYFRGDYVRLDTQAIGYGEFSHPTLKAREFNIESAQEAFARAGFNKRGPDGILVNESGERLSFTLSTGYERYKDLMTILKEEAVKAGLEFRVEMLDSTAGWKKAQEKKHDIHFAAFGVTLEMYPRFWDFSHSENAYDNGAFLEDGSVNPERSIKTQTNNLELVADPDMDEMINRYRQSEDRSEMLALSHKMLEWRHEYGSFVPGFINPAYRDGHWRWFRYPDYFNHKHSSHAVQLGVHWIDTDLKEETLNARKEGITFEPQINVYDQFFSP